MHVGYSPSIPALHPQEAHGQPLGMVLVIQYNPEVSAVVSSNPRTFDILILLD